MLANSADPILAIVAIGMGVAFVAADPKSPTSRALAVALGFLGVGALFNVARDSAMLPASELTWSRAYSIDDTLITVSLIEWVLRVARTELQDASRVERRFRISQFLAILYGVLGVTLPKLRNDVFMSARVLDRLSTPAYYLFAVPLFLSVGIAIVTVGQVLNSRRDSLERVRLNAMGLATPFLMTGFFAPRWSPVGTAIGEMIFLIGAVRYHVMQGQRAQFIGRFLSPEVGRLVRERGLAAATQQNRVELSVVACDLRGFTSFSDASAPEEVMQLTRDYYAAVSDVVTEFGGTIESFAGDGIVSLIGAPLFFEDHAHRAVGMALKIIDRVTAMLSSWRKSGQPLGIGVGISSGYVTVGVLGGEARLEYVAVGPAVNLAARLCNRAESGQALTDQRTVAILDHDGDGARAYRFERLESAELKGFARQVTIFAISADTNAGSEKPSISRS